MRKRIPTLRSTPRPPLRPTLSLRTLIASLFTASLGLAGCASSAADRPASPSSTGPSPTTLSSTGSKSADSPSKKAVVRASQPAKLAAQPGAAVRPDLVTRPDLAMQPGITVQPEVDYPASRPELRAFIDSMTSRHGFDAGLLAATFTEVRRSPDVLRLMAPAPSGFKRSWKAYRARFIDRTRLSAGLRFWQENAEAVQRASTLHGVPEEVIVSIIGVETVFGRITGNFRVIDALSTLAFDYPRRAEYFRSELEQYLLYVREQQLDPFSVLGSYAGAVGLPQFMPGSIRRWAVDFDGDGHIDLRASPADAIGSVANFLAAHGWARGEPLRYGIRVANPAALAPLVQAGIEPALTIAELRERGITSADPVAVDARLALVDLPNADDPPDYWLGGQNFYTITRYNRSSFYAMAVIELAQALRDARDR